MDAIYKAKDNYVTTHRSREAKQQGGLKKGAWISLGKRNRFLEWTGVGVDGNNRKQVGERWRERVMG